MTVSDADLNNLAWTMLGEAKPSDPNGMAAVGNTVLNRLAAGTYGSSITDIVKAPNQYAAWGIGSQAASQGNNPSGRFPVTSPLFQQAKALASQLVNGEVQDNTGGAVEYRQTGSTKRNGVDIGGNTFFPNHPVSAGTQLIAQEPNAAALDVYSSTYGWTSLPDANPTTGAPVTNVAEAQQARSPADAISAIEQATGQSISGAPSDALAYGSDLPVQQPVPLAPQQPADPAQAPVAADAAPVPGPRPPQLTGAARDQAALGSIRNWLKGSNVNLDAVPPAQQAALVKALPKIASLQNDPKGELNFLQQSGLYDALAAAVPTHAPSFAENAWAAVNGVKLPPKIPNDLASWNLPTGGDPNAALTAITGMIGEAGDQRVPNYTPDTGSPLGGPLAAPSANALSSWMQPYTSAFPGSTGNSQGGNGPSGAMEWAAPYFNGQQDTGTNGTVTPQGPNFANTGADIASLDIASSVQVPKYITIQKQVQVPDDQPIEQGSAGVVWDPASQSYKLQDAPPAAAPKMITKTVPTRVLNPKYVAPAAAPASPWTPPANQPIASTNGYNYLRNASGGYTNVGQSQQAQGMTPEEQYAAAAARARASQPNGNVNNMGNVPGASQANGSQQSHSLGGMPG